MEFRILGPLEVLDGGREVPLGGSKQRALLAFLLLHANRVVPRDRLIDELWDTAPPETARTALQVHVSQLRKALGRDAIVTRAPGYVIQVGPGELDLERFERLVAAADRTDASQAAKTLREALALWRGPPLADLGDSVARAERAQLEEQRLLALEQRIDADLELGLHAQLVPELEALVREHPLRERLRAQLMLALYRCGRQAEALDAYQRGRRLLSDELGLEPGDRLKQLEKAILEQDPSLALDERRLPAAAEEAAAIERRRLLRLRRSRLLVLVGALLIAGALAGILIAVTGGSAVMVVANSVAVVNPRTGEIVADVPIGGRPVGIAVGAGAVWVANADDQTVSRIDPKTRKVAETIGLGTDVTDIAYGFGAVWVTEGNDGTVARIDPRQIALQERIKLGRAGELVPQPVFLVAAGAGRVWVTRGNDVLRIDPRKNTVAGRTPVLHPLSVGAGAGSAWVTTQNEHILSIDATRGRIIGDHDLLQEASFPVLRNGSLWLVVFSQTPQILRLDPGTLSPLGPIRFPGEFPIGLAAGEGALWTVDHERGGVWRIDPASDRMTRIAKVAKHPIAVAAGEGAVWVGVQEEPFR